MTMKCDRETAIRRLTNRWNEQVEMFPKMREETPLDMFLAMNYRTVMSGQLPPDIGLFSNDADQLDLVEMLQDPTNEHD